MKARWKQINYFLLSILFIVPAISYAGVRWQRVGHPVGAEKIAACADGRIYALHRSGELYVSRSEGRDGSWVRMGRFPELENVSCARNELFVYRSGRRILRNAGSETSPRWSEVGNPWGAEIVKAGAWARNRIFFALNDDKTLWYSYSGQNGTWTRVGRPGAADKIAVANVSSLYHPTVFALNNDRTLWINDGFGQDAHWVRIDRPASAEEITAVNRDLIYALNRDQTLWKGTVERQTEEVVIDVNGFRTLTAILGLPTQNRLRLHGGTGTFTPSSFLQSAGVGPTSFALPSGPFDAEFRNVSSQTLHATLEGNEINLRLRFEERGDELRLDFPAPNFDIERFIVTATLRVHQKSLGERVIVPVNVKFHGNFEANGPLNPVWDIVEDLADFRGQVTRRLQGEATGFFEKGSTQRALKRALLDVARVFTGSSWDKVRYGNLRMSGTRIIYYVDRY